MLAGNSFIYMFLSCTEVVCLDPGFFFSGSYLPVALLAAGFFMLHKSECFESRAVSARRR